MVASLDLGNGTDIWAHIFIYRMVFIPQLLCARQGRSPWEEENENKRWVLLVRVPACRGVCFTVPVIPSYLGG